MAALTIVLSFAAQSMTVAEYSRQFFDRVLRKSYAQTEAENATIAGQKFCSKAYLQFVTCYNL